MMSKGRKTNKILISLDKHVILTSYAGKEKGGEWNQKT